MDKCKYTVGFVYICLTYSFILPPAIKYHFVDVKQVNIALSQITEQDVKRTDIRTCTPTQFIE